MKEFAQYDVIVVYNESGDIREVTEKKGISKARAEQVAKRKQNDRTCTPLDIKVRPSCYRK